jgi:quercetin dioxygenase-like cupin family protein
MDNTVDRRTILGCLAGAFAFSLVPDASEVQSFVMEGNQARVDSRSYGQLHIYLDGPAGGLKRLLVSQTTLKVGERPHPPHSHPEGEMLLVTEGAGEVSLQNKVSRVGAGTVLYAAPNDVHGVTNTGSSPMTYYVFRWLAK